MWNRCFSFVPRYQFKGAGEMANLKVSIVVRTKDSDGKRGWVPAAGKNDPAGPLYLRYYNGSSPKHVKAGRFYDEAEVAKLRLERKLTGRRVDRACQGNYRQTRLTS
jgi:hypothetical protein